MSVSTSIAHTAIDALNAKLSLLSVGYEPVSLNGDQYKSALHLIASHIAKRKTVQKNKSKNKKTLNIDEQTQAELKDTVTPAPNANRSHQLNSYPENIVKRQCPLVNAGYAARMAIVTCALDQFLSYHIKSHDILTTQINKKITGSTTSGKINIILLGGGMDAIGIWASSISDKFRKEKQIDFSAHLYDLDCVENCQLKLEALRQTGLWEPIEMSDSNYSNDNVKAGNNEKTSLYAEGLVDLSCLSHNDSVINDQINMNSQESYNKEKCINERDKYSLISVDLKNVSDLDSSLNTKAMIDWKSPTIIISELVLAYLGNEAANQIIQFFSSSLSNTPNSAFVAFEPMGSIDDSKSPSTNQNEYVSDYCSRFTEKLNRGVHYNRNSHATSFEPFGPSCTSIQKRFDYYCKGSSLETLSIPASKAITISKCNSCLKKCPEIFDEHAALVMHLKCYALIILYSLSNVDDEHIDETNSTIPAEWLSMKEKSMRGKIAKFKMTEKKARNKEVQISSINSNLYDRGVKSLFLKTYSPYFNEYSEVKKMVKSALKTDLSCTPNFSNAKEKIDVDEHNSNVSLIGIQYRKMGGDFWIATLDDSNSNESPAKSGSNQTVIACLGVRKCDQTKVKGNMRYSKSQTSFELYRLAVDSSYRGQRIGSMLLEYAESFCKEAVREHDNKIEIFAETIAQLAPANQFYLSHGFIRMEQKAIGKVIILTYKKVINF